MILVSFQNNVAFVEVNISSIFAITRYEKQIEFPQNPSGNDIDFAYVFSRCNQTLTHWCFMFTAHMPGVQHRVEEREVKARMDTPAVRAVLDMGFERNVVLNAIRKQLSNRGKQNCKNKNAFQ